MIDSVRPEGDDKRQIAIRLNQAIKFLNGGSNVRTATTTDTSIVEDGLVKCDATGGAFTVTLPDARIAAKRPYYYKKIDASVNAVTLDGNGAQTIDGVATKSLASQWSVLAIFPDGSNWLIV